MVIMGLPRLPKWSTAAVVCCVPILLISNGLFLNNGILTKDNPIAQDYYKSIESLPSDSAVITYHGGPYGLGMVYATLEHPDLAPIFLMKPDGYKSRGYVDYCKWVADNRGLSGANWIEQTDTCLSEGRPTFVEYNIQPPYWQKEINARYITEPYNEFFRKVTGAVELTNSE
jgi:hypothetical protein